MHNKIMKISAIVAAICILLFGIVSLLSDEIACWYAGETEKVATYYGRDLNGKEYAVVVGGTQDEVGKILYLSKGFAGFWTVEMTSQKADEATGMVELYWNEIYGTKFHISSAPMKAQYDCHLMVSGNNAIAEITIPKDYLPEGVTVGVQQWGSRYVLHLMSYNGDWGALANIDVYDMLKTAHCVQ